MNARKLEHFPNLVTMFFTRAREKGDAPFLWAQARRRLGSDQLGRGGAAGREPGRRRCRRSG